MISNPIPWEFKLQNNSFNGKKFFNFCFAFLQLKIY